MAGKGMREIKQRIKSVTSMEHITSAMKLVSSAKLKRAKDASEKVKKHFHFVTDSIEDVFKNAGSVKSHYLENDGKGKKCYILITSNRGLCGSYNSNAIKAAVELLAGDKENTVLVTIGTKGRDYFAKRGYKIISEYTEAPDTITFTDTHLVSKPILDLYDAGEISEVTLIKTSFINTISQQVQSVKLLPFELKPGNKSTSEKLDLRQEVEYGPSVEAVFNYMVPKYTEMIIFEAIAESVTCEHAARRMAMESATDNAREIIGDLTLNYNRARQAAITQEISEIVSGAEALK